MQLATDATNANGNALANQEKYMDSYAGMIQSIKTEFDSFAISLTDDDIIKGGLNIAKNLLKGINDGITEGKSSAGYALATLFSGLIGKTAINWGGGLIAQFATTKLPKAFSNIKNLGAIGQISKASSANELSTIVAGAMRDRSKEDIIKALSAAGYGETVIQQTLTDINQNGIITQETAQRLNQLSESANTASSKFTGLATTLGMTTTSLKALCVGMGALASVFAIYSLVSEYNKEQEKMAELARSSADSVKSQTSSLSDTVEKIKELRKQYDDSNTSESDALEIKKQLYEIQNNLNDTYGTQAEKIDIVNGKLSEELGLLEKLSKQEVIDWLGKIEDGGFLTKEKTHRETGIEAINTFNQSNTGVGDKYTSDYFHITDRQNGTGTWDEGFVSSINKALEDSGITAAFSDTGTLSFSGEDMNQQELADALNKAITKVQSDYSMDSSQRDTYSQLFRSAVTPIESRESEDATLREQTALGLMYEAGDEIGKDFKSSYETLLSGLDKFESAENKSDKQKYYNEVAEGLSKLEQEYSTSNEKNNYNEDDKESYQLALDYLLDQVQYRVNSEADSSNFYTSAQKSDVEKKLRGTSESTSTSKNSSYGLQVANAILDYNNATTEAAKNEAISKVDAALAPLNVKAGQIASENEQALTYAKEYNDTIATYGNGLLKGNLDFTNRPKISPEQMRLKGYDVGDGEYVNTFDSDYAIGDGDNKYTVKVTPILPDGTVLTEEELSAYVNDTLGAQSTWEDILAADTKGLIIAGVKGAYEENEEVLTNLDNDLGVIKDKYASALEGDTGVNSISDYISKAFTKFASGPFTKFASGKSIVEFFTGKSANSNDLSGTLDTLRENSRSGKLTKSELLVDYDNNSDSKGMKVLAKEAEEAGVSVEGLIDILVELGEVEDDVSSKDVDLKTTKSAEDAVADLVDAVSGLDSVFSTLKGGTSLDASGIASLKDTLSKSGLDSSGITEYVNQLVSATGDASKQMQIIKDIKTEIGNTKIDFSGYDADEIDYLISQVEKLGYTWNGLNGTAITSAEQQVSAISQTIQSFNEQAEVSTTAAQQVLSSCQIDESALEAEAKAAGMTKEAYYGYIAQKLVSSGTIDTSGDIIALSAVCSALGQAASAWLTYYKAKANMEAMASATTDSQKQRYALGTIRAIEGQEGVNKFWGSYGRGSYAPKNTKTKNTKNIVSDAVTTATNAFNNYSLTEAFSEAKKWEDTAKNQKFTATGATPSTGTGSGSGSGDKGSSDTTKKETQDWIDWYERRITVLQKLHDAQEEVSNDEMKSYTDRAAAVSSLIDQDKELLEVYNAQADNYKDWYNTSLDKFKSKYFNENGVMTDDNGVEYTIDELKSLIENGGLEASSFTGDKLEDINSLISSYDEYKDIVDKIDEKEKEAADHWKQYYEMRISELDEYLTLAQGEQSQIENQISIKEALGKVVQASDYQSLISSSKEQVGLLEDQIDTYEDMLGELREGSSEYNQVLAKIQSCESSIYQCKLNQIEWNESIKNIPITRIEKYLNVLSGIQSELTDYMSNQESKGNANTADQYEELMSLGQEQLSKLLEQQKLYKEKLSDYEWGSDKYDETVTSIDDIDSSISSVISSMTEWSQSILSIPINKLSEVNENLQATVDALDDISSKYDEVISAVTDSIDDEIDKLNDERDATEDAYQDKIDAIQDVIDALEKENEAREKQLAIEDAQYDLEKAYNNKSVATIQNGKVVYEADQDAVRDAQEALDEANYNKKIYDLEQQIEDLEDERDKLLDDYDDRIDKLQDISDKWSEITTNIQHAKDVLSADEFLGDGWLSKVLSGNDDDIYTTFKNLYETLDKNRTSYEEQIESNNRISTLMQNYVDAYVSGSVTYEKALAGVQELTSQIATGLSETENLTKLLSFFDKGDLTETLKAFNDTAVTEANNYEKYFEAVKANAELTDKYTKTWEDMKASIEEQVKALKEAYEAAVKAAETAQETAKTYSSSSGGGGNTVSNTYVVISSGADGLTATKYESYSAYQSGNKSNASSSGSLRGSSSGKEQKAGTAYKFHVGLEKGYVGALSSNDRLEALKKLSLTPLKDNEVPAILKAGEVVMTTGQQDNLLKNVSRLGVNEGAIVASSPSVTLNMSNLTFNEVQNGQDFANFITKNITTAVAQNLSKK